jgi:tetratricopeptide (TPR) repeat protein
MGPGRRAPSGRAVSCSPLHEPTEHSVYSIILSTTLALLLGFSGFFFDWWGWGWSILFTLVLFVVIWIVIARTLATRLQPAMERVQKQMQAELFEPAMQSLESMLPMGKWVPLLRGQLLAQMGMLAYYTGKKEKALSLLESASLRAPDARLLLACIHYKNGDVARALQILQIAAAVNKKHPLLHNTYAWMLHKNDRADDAQKLLGDFLKRDANNAPTKDNMLRLQNRTRMTMQAFGMQWYALGLEQPPQAMGQMRRAPKGFREPPKRSR